MVQLHDLNKNRLEPPRRLHSFDDNWFGAPLISVQELYEIQRRLRWSSPAEWNATRRVPRYDDWHRSAQS